MATDNLETEKRFTNLEGILSASSFMQQGKEGEPLAREALEGVYKKLSLDNYSSGLAKTLRDPKIVGLAIKNVSEEYQEIKEGLKIQEFSNIYSSDLKKYLGDYSEEATKEFAQQGNITYGEIMKKLAIAEHTIKGEKLGVSSKEKVEEAKKVLEKLNPVIFMINSIEHIRTRNYSAKVEDTYLSNAMQGIYQKEEQSA